MGVRGSECESAQAPGQHSQGFKVDDNRSGVWARHLDVMASLGIV